MYYDFHDQLLFLMLYSQGSIENITCRCVQYYVIIEVVCIMKVGLPLMLLSLN